MQANRSFVALTAALVTLCSIALAQATQSEQGPAVADASWLRAGASWQYLVTQKSPEQPAAGEPSLHKVTAESTAHMPDGTELHQLRVGRGEQGITTFELWSVTGDQVLQHAIKSMLRRGSLHAAAASMQIWQRNKLDAVRPQQWQWLGPLLGADLGSGNRAGESGVGEWHHRAESLGNESIDVPAGRFKAEHIRIRSEQDGSEPFLRDLWLVPGVGVVCDERRCGQHQRMQRLKTFTPGGKESERLIGHLEEQLQKNRVKLFNNMPRVTWLEAGPEALLVAGRIAAVHTDGWRSMYFVGRESIARFGLSGGGLAGAAYAAFDSKTAVPSEDLDLQALAVLLARSEAALLQFGNVRPVPVTLAPTRALRAADREASAQITGGALDGSQRNIAVRLAFGRAWSYDLATDLPTDLPASAKEDPSAESGRGR
ncbi:MAG: hypothetical protein ACI85K_001268 [Hyphomicrobiaceae bacterium]|jgi:hypothetical protein